MEVGSPSRTAILTAIHRAAHFVIDDPPKILADSFARALAGFSSDNEFLAAVDSYVWTSISERVEARPEDDILRGSGRDSRRELVFRIPMREGWTAKRMPFFPGSA